MMAMAKPTSPSPGAMWMAMAAPTASRRRATPPREWQPASGQHGYIPPLRPREPGSVTVVGKFAACVVGAAYDDATLRVAGFTYTLEQVLVTGCAATPGNSGGEPTQSIRLNYLHRKLNKL